VLILLFLGALDINTFTADIQTAVSATRQAARLGSILGSQVCSSPPLTWIDVDTIIVEDVRAIASTMNAASLNEIDIYRPDNGTGYGAYRPGLDTHVDRFNGTGMLISQAFPLSERVPIAPDEASIGINLKWTFTHINNQGGVGSVTLNTYSVFKVLAVPTGC
jgi:hypothetical protein